MEMQSTKLVRAKPTEATQKYLKIAEIKEDTIVLKDGGLRGIIVVSSTNFALKSEEEQNALIAAYQNLLNSLDFPLQILIHSRILDISSYLEKLRSLEAGQTNELLRIQMSEYIEYVGRLVETANIMSKTFYVIVPYTAEAVKDTFSSKIAKIFNPAKTISNRQEDFQKAKLGLQKRLDHVMGGLGGIGLRALVLNTEELMELLYLSYNFGAVSPLHTGALEEIEVSQ